MVGSVNKVILVGNLGRDPEIRSMQSGNKMASFSIAFTYLPAIPPLLWVTLQLNNSKIQLKYSR